MSSNSFMWGWWMVGYIIEILYSEYYPENSNLHYEVVMVLSQHYPQRRILIIIPRYLLSLPPTQVTDSIYDLVGAICVSHIPPDHPRTEISSGLSALLHRLLLGLCPALPGPDLREDQSCRHLP